MDHNSTLLSPRIASSGQIIPFDPGAGFYGMTLQERRQHIDGYLYRVETSQGIKVLYESLAYFQAPWQNQVWENVHNALQNQGLWDPETQHFQHTWQKITLNYVTYPAWVWEAFQHPVAAHCWQAGLLPEEELRSIYDTLRYLQQTLAEKGWTNPSLVLPQLFFRDGSPQPIGLDWSCAVPLNKSLVYPRFFKGYHPEHITDPLQLTQQGTYHTILGLLMGRSPHFWAPEPMTFQAIYTLLSPEMRSWLKQWEQPMHPEQWPDLPPNMYNPTKDTSPYQSASQHFNQGFTAYHERDFETAAHHGKLAAGLWSIDPWPHFLLSRCADAVAQSSENPEAELENALIHLQQALRNQPLGLFYREKARLLLKRKQPLEAQQAIEKALEVSPYDDAAWHLCSLLCAQNQHLQQAEYAIRQACQLKPLNSVYRQQWIHLLEQVGAHDSAARLHCFAAGQPARLSRVFTRADQLEPQIHPPGPWRWASAQPPDLAQAQKGCEVWHEHTGQKGYLKALTLSEAQVHYDLDQQPQLLNALHQDYPGGFTPVLDSYTLGKHRLVIYAYRAGKTLAQQLKVTPLTPGDWQKLAIQAAELLNTLERHQVIHGDITPDNLIWHEEKLTLVDYENLRSLHKASVPRSYQVTPEYAAPEFWKKHQASTLGDHYSMALVLLEAATGIFPDLCRHWKQRDFSGFETYLTHLPGPMVDQLLAASRWDPGLRQKLTQEGFALPIKRQPARSLPELAKLLRQIAESEAAETFQTLQDPLLELEKNALSYYHLAYHAQRLGLSTISQSAASQCLRLIPYHVGAHWVLAENHRIAGDYAQALSVLQKSLTYGAEEPETYRRLLQIYCHQNQLALALAACEHLERCLPFHGSVRLEKAATLAHFGLHHQAAAITEQLTRASGPLKYRHSH